MLENETTGVRTEVTQGEDLISLESLADLTGFPVEMIRTELFNSELTEERISLDTLRKAMVNYIDATMLEDANK